MASVNKCQFLGNLTRDPELKHLQSGTAVCEFGIAVNKKLGGGKPDRVLFLDVTLFDKKAEVAAEYLRKGSQVYLDGELVLDQWDDKATGQKRSKHKLTAFDFQMLGKRGDESSQDGRTEDEYSQASPVKRQAAPATDPSDIPFSLIGFLLTAATLGSTFLT